MHCWIFGFTQQYEMDQCCTYDGEMAGGRFEGVGTYESDRGEGHMHMMYDDS